eukprot:s1916_g3.t1
MVSWSATRTTNTTSPNTPELSRAFLLMVAATFSTLFQSASSFGPNAASGDLKCLSQIVWTGSWCADLCLNGNRFLHPPRLLRNKNETLARYCKICERTVIEEWWTRKGLSVFWLSELPQPSAELGTPGQAC